MQHTLCIIYSINKYNTSSTDISQWWLFPLIFISSVQKSLFFPYHYYLLNNHLYKSYSHVFMSLDDPFIFSLSISMSFEKYLIISTALPPSLSVSIQHETMIITNQLYLKLCLMSPVLFFAKIYWLLWVFLYEFYRNVRIYFYFYK